MDLKAQILPHKGWKLNYVDYSVYLLLKTFQQIYVDKYFSVQNISYPTFNFGFSVRDSIKRTTPFPMFHLHGDKLHRKESYSMFVESENCKNYKIVVS